MSNSKKQSLCKSHITQLRKVATQLAYRQTMSYTQLILSETNENKIKEAEYKIYNAINILKEIR